MGMQRKMMVRLYIVFKFQSSLLKRSTFDKWQKLIAFRMLPCEDEPHFFIFYCHADALKASYMCNHRGLMLTPTLIIILQRKIIMNLLESDDGVKHRSRYGSALFKISSPGFTVGNGHDFPYDISDTCRKEVCWKKI